MRAGWSTSAVPPLLSLLSRENFLCPGRWLISSLSQIDVDAWTHDSRWKLLCFSSGGERSGGKPHSTTHSAAPQVRAGHCPRGGQHLRVLQRSLNLPVSSLPAISFSCWQLPFSYLHSYLGMSATEELAFISVIIVPTGCWEVWKLAEQKDLNLPLKRPTFHEVFLLWSGKAEQLSQIASYDMDRITVWLSYALEGKV